MSTDAPAKLSYSDISDWVWNEFRTGAHFDASQITSGVFAVDRVPGLPASKITSGVFAVDRVPGFPASKITSGEIHIDRIPQLDAATKIIGVLPISLGGTGGTTAASARLNLGVPLPTTETPEAPTKEGSVGNLSTIFARGDHSHPEQTTIAYVAAPSTQATDTLPIALESPAYPGSESSYSGFYSPADGTIVMRTGADSYKFEYNKATLGEDVSLIGRNDDADINDPKPLYISGASAATKGGTIALGGSNYPSLSLRVDNKSYLYLSEGAAFPVTIGDNTYVNGNIETSGYVSADALYGTSAQAERMTLTPIERADLPGSLPSFGVIYFDATDRRFYGRNNNAWEILNSKNADFTLAGLSEKSYNSLTDKPTIPTNSSFTLAGLGEKDFASLTNKPTTLAGYGITDAASSSNPSAPHTHGNITNAGAIGTTSGLVVTTTTDGVLTTSNRPGIDSRSTFPPDSHALNSHTACTLAQINALISDATLIDTGDTRLSDARPARDVSAWAKAANKPSYTYSEVGAAASGHTHNYAGSSSAGGAANSVANTLAITLNGGTTEGLDKFTFDGSESKSINIVTTEQATPDQATPGVVLDFLKTSIDSFSCAEFEQYPALVSAPVIRLITMPSEITTQYAFEWINENYTTGVATYTDGPAHGKGVGAFFGSVLMPNGKVMLTPYDSSANIGIYDPVANTYTDGPAHGKGTFAFWGSALMPNGKVMLTPRNSANIGIYDPITNTYTDGPAHGKTTPAFSGSTLLPNGKVMLAPYKSANIGIYDPASNTYTDGPAHGKGAEAFSGSTLMPNGKVMLTPFYSANIGIYDPVADTYTDGPAHGKGIGAFSGSTLMPNGKVMLTPLYSANIGIYDPVANTYTDGPAHGKGSGAFSGSTLMPNGKVMLTPYKPANIGIYDPIANTYTDGPVTGKGGTYAFQSSILMPNGKVMLTPHNSPNIGIYDPAIIDLELRNWPLLSAYFNKF